MDETQDSFETVTWKSRLRSMLTEYSRVLRITKKPSKEEYKTIVKVSGLGIAIIGAIGFLIHLISQIFFKT